MAQHYDFINRLILSEIETPALFLKGLIAACEMAPIQTVGIVWAK